MANKEGEYCYWMNFCVSGFLVMLGSLTYITNRYIKKRYITKLMSDVFMWQSGRMVGLGVRQANRVAYQVASSHNENPKLMCAKILHLKSVLV